MISSMSECVDVYVIDNAYTKIVHHFREVHYQMKLEKKMRYKGYGRGEKQDTTAQQREKN